VKLLTLRKLHKWLALCVGLQVVVWTASGLAFAWLDHGAIEGEGLTGSPAPQLLASTEAVVEPAALRLDASEVDALSLASVDGQWVYRIETSRGVELRRAADATPFVVDATVARHLAAAWYRGAGRLASLRFHAGPTQETRGLGATWEAVFDDGPGSRLYFSADDGALVAVRTDAWRLKDVFWILHTMDYRGRDDFNHPLVVIAAASAAWVALTGLWLLLRVFRRS
jgi:Na+-transporting NADH:ubiquinone oxidoreductase subunit F